MGQCSLQHECRKSHSPQRPHMTLSQCGPPHTDAHKGFLYYHLLSLIGGVSRFGIRGGIATPPNPYVVQSDPHSVVDKTTTVGADFSGSKFLEPRSRHITEHRDNHAGFHVRQVMLTHRHFISSLNCVCGGCPCPPQAATRGHYGGLCPLAMMGYHRSSSRGRRLRRGTKAD